MADTNGKKTTASKAKKTAVTPNTVAVQKSVLTANTLPTAEVLKVRFKAGSIPLQSDFADLIDMANIGRTAVGDSGTGWGLNKDGQGRLQWDFSRIYNTIYDLSASSSSDRIVISNQFSGETSVHHRIALLAIHSETGPTRAVNTQVGDSTTFTRPAIKTDNNGKRSKVDVNIIAKKAVGKTGNYIPFEYVTTNDALYSIWYQFTLDAPEVDLNTCTLVIDPLMLSINLVTDAAKDPVGEVVSLMVVNFTCNSARQIIPRGLISMFSRSKVPPGWLFCDGSHDTPDLRDRFIMGGYVEDAGGVSSTKFYGEKNSKSFSFTSDSASISYSGNTEGSQLSLAQIPNHKHFSGIRLNEYQFSQFGSTRVSGHLNSLPVSVKTFNDPYIFRTSGVEGSDNSQGNAKAHSHAIKINSGEHSHNNKVTVPYYILAFIMKA